MNSLDSIIFDKVACRTGLGDAQLTCNQLLENVVALKKLNVLGSDGGEMAPLALRSPMEISQPPRWWQDLVSFYEIFEDDKWGSSRFPVIVTSSNFGIDALYGLGQSRDLGFAPWSTSDRCVDEIAKAFRWKSNLTLISHACVSSQLGILQASKLLEKNLADSVLVFSFDYVGPFVAAGFHSLKILNEEMPSPYTNKDVGAIGLGDGIAAAILKRGRSGWAIQQQSTFNEMHHFTANKPDGSGFYEILNPFKEFHGKQKFWIKGHGTGTLDAGKLESTITDELFPDAPLVSWKGSLGHTLGSCALVELAIAIKAMELGKIPGTVGSKAPYFSDNVASESFPAASFDGCILLSNAFGGAHAAMYLSHV